MADATLRIEVDAKDAEKSLSRFASSAERATAGLEKSFGALKAAAGAAFAFVAGRAVVGAIGDFVKAAQEQEQALQNVATAMGRTGEFSKAAFADVQAFADGLQSVKGVSDDAALSAFALAKSFGASNEQAKLAVDAAVELSAATGKSLEESIRGVSKTLGGMAGELGEVNPAIKALTAEQLKAGKAAEILLAQFGGTAAANLQTFGGALMQTKNAFGELQESFGNLIVQNPVIIKIIQEVGSVFDSLSKSLDANGDGIRGLINKGISTLIQGFGEIIPVFKIILTNFDLLSQVALTAGAGVLQFVRVFTQFELVQTVIKTTASVFIALVDKITTGIRVIVQTVGVLGEKLGLNTGITDDLTDALEGFRSKLTSVDDGLADLDINGKLDGATETLLNFRETSTNAFAAAKEAIDGAAKSTKDFGKELGKLGSTTAGPSAKNLPGGGGGGGRPVDPAKASLIGPPVPVQGASGFGGSLGIADILAREAKAGAIAFGQSFFANLGGGKEGARKFVADIGGGVATAIGGPVVGDAFKQALDLLGQDPEAFGEVINGFVKGIPQIIDNIVANIPTLVIAIADNIGPIITALVSASPRIIVALAQAMPTVAAALVNSLGEGIAYQLEKFTIGIDTISDTLTAGGEAVGEFFSTIPETISAGFQAALDALGSGFSDIAASFGEQFTDSVADAGIAFYNGIVDSVSALIDPLVEFFESLDFTSDIGGGGQGLIPNSVPVLGGLATGGTIPAGYPNDSFPAALTSGEEVFDTTTSEQLRDFLGQGQATMIALLQQIVSGRGQEVRISLSEDGLAKALLRLDYANARTSR